MTHTALIQQKVECYSLSLLSIRNLIEKRWLKSCSKPIMYLRCWCSKQACSLCAAVLVVQLVLSLIQVHDGVTTVYPVYEGHNCRNAIRRIDFGGKDLTHYLMKMLNENEQNPVQFATTSDREIVRDMKEKLCYVSNLEKPSDVFEQKSYTLPDGQVINLGKEMFQCPEAMFDPSLFGMDFPGVHQLVYDSLMACDIDTRRDFYCNVIISGGNTMFNGFPERLSLELTKLIPKTMKSKVVAPPERAYSVWIGGSILGSLSSSSFISRAEYNEHGPSVMFNCNNC